MRSCGLAIVSMLSCTEPMFSKMPRTRWISQLDICTRRSTRPIAAATAPGAPAIAQRVHALIGAAGLPSHLDPTRGFDHGTFAPLVVMYPDADVPVLQLSLRHNMDPAQHLAVGRAIAPLRRAEDAVELDTGALTFEESLQLLLETIRRRAKL